MRPFLDGEMKKILNLSRAKFGLGDYISFDEYLQEDLLSIVDSIESYINSPPREGRPLCVYLEATPGSGKSFLVRSIVKAVSERQTTKEVLYQERNISQCDSQNSFLTVFEWVRTSNISQVEMPIVFFDEVDTEINGTSSFRHFLGPMLDGSYYDPVGDKRTIGPCILFFAASKTLLSFSADKVQIQSKNVGYRDWRDAVVSNTRNIIEGWSDTQVPTELPSKMLDFIERVRLYIYVPPPGLIVNSHLPEPRQIKDSYNNNLFIVASFLFRSGITLVDSKALYYLAIKLGREQKLRKVQFFIERIDKSKLNDGCLAGEEILDSLRDSMSISDRKDKKDALSALSPQGYKNFTHRDEVFVHTIVPE